MAEINGLTGLRPANGFADLISTPPYDVIKPGSPLEHDLKSNPDSLYHIILGQHPAEKLKEFRERDLLQADNEPCYYIYEQTWGGGHRLGFLASINVDDYSNHNIIRHEKTFDNKVQGRIKLTRQTGYNFGPIFFLTKSSVTSILNRAVKGLSPLYAFTTSMKNFPDLHDIKSRIFRVPEQCETGKALKKAVSENPLYIADGHHRYHAALRNKQDSTLGYIVQDARILAYNRVMTGNHSFASIMHKLPLKPCERFETPPRHCFCIYHKSGTYLLQADKIPSDAIGKLDSHLLTEILYPYLGINKDIISDQDKFDYYPETEKEFIIKAVDSGKYDIAVALHPVSIEELMSVADAGLTNPDVVMPEKSTFFSPKILSGIFLQKNQ